MPCRLTTHGVALHAHQADGRNSGGMTRWRKPNGGLSQSHAASCWRNRRELHDVEPCAAACTAYFPVGCGAVREAHETVVRDGDREDIRGEGGESGVAVVRRLTVDVPGDGRGLGMMVLQQAGLEHVFLKSAR